MIAQSQLTAGIHRIELPLPFELEAINLYLVRLDQSYLLVDCGLNTPQSFDALESGLQRIGITWRDIRIILLTHMHPDHIGLCARVRELSGAMVLMHEAEAEHLNSLDHETRRLPYLHEAYTRGGVPAERQAEMDRDFAFARKSLHDITPDRFLRGGDVIDSAIGPLTVLSTPGHSPGHICLYARDAKVLFSGDHILNKITPNISWHPGTDALGDYLESLEQVGQLDVEQILPAHGEPFSGHREWIAVTVAHHAKRCDQIIAAVTDGATTADEIAGRLWTRCLEPIHHHFAVFEILAHLEYMRRQGRVAADDSNTAIRWRVVADTSMQPRPAAAQWPDR